MASLTLRALLIAVLSGTAMQAQVDSLDGLWQGYEGEWRHVSNQLIALAETLPPEAFTWRPAPKVRSTSEVFMHIALANFSLLKATGPNGTKMMPADLTSEISETKPADKADVIKWLKRSLEAVRSARAAMAPADLHLRVRINGRNADVDGIYLRILVHANEHMGQLVAYGRTQGIAPPWSH